MSVTQQQVLDALAKVKSPRGVALTNANVLSAVSVSDGKVILIAGLSPALPGCQRVVPRSGSCSVVCRSKCWPMGCAWVRSACSP